MNAPMEKIKKTLYDLLGIRPEATQEEIEVAYRAAVSNLQPEIDAGRPDVLNQLRLLREAYHILSDEQRRARYDGWMSPLEGAIETPAEEEQGSDGLGLAIIVTLILIAIGAMLTVFLLLDRAGTARTEYMEIVRQKQVEENRSFQNQTVPRDTATPLAPEQKP